jgi:23S rRNA (pseudouridine1915-N3)-methyltransferase
LGRRRLRRIRQAHAARAAAGTEGDQGRAAQPSGKPVEALLAAEAGRIGAALPPRGRLVALDERGADLTTRQLAERLRRWMEAGDDVALVIGGPDGLAPELKDRAAETLRLSSLTLPHALARVLLAEALYRAASLLKNHPYHRE